MKKYFVFLTIMMLTACELVVDIDVPFEGEQLTVNSFFSPDSVWRASVSLNRFILNTQPFRRVTNATVIVSDENGPVDTLVHEGNGVYRSDNGKPQARKRYTISASTVVHGAVHAESFVPPAALVSNVEIQSSDFNGEPSSRITLQISDEPTTENYYAITVEIGYEYLSPEYEVLSFRYPAMLGRDDEGFQEDEQITNDNAMLIKDVFYSGPEMNVTVHSPDWNLVHAPDVYVSVKTISKDYYDFILTSSLQNQTSGNPFAQPVQVYSNVQNGFGIFAGYSSYTVAKTQIRPTITSVTPQSGRPGEQIVVKATNVGFGMNSNTALIFEGIDHGMYSYPLGGSGETMTFYIPPDAKTGRLWLQSNGKITEWQGGFTILN